MRRSNIQLNTENTVSVYVYIKEIYPLLYIPCEANECGKKWCACGWAPDRRDGGGQPLK